MALGAVDVLSFLQSRVPGLSISVAGSQASATWRGSQTDFFVNELNTPIQQVQNINIADIAYIKALRPPFFGSSSGSGGSGGAIAIYTKQGSSNKGGNMNSKGMENVVLGVILYLRNSFIQSMINPQLVLKQIIALPYIGTPMS